MDRVRGCAALGLAGLVFISACGDDGASPVDAAGQDAGPADGGALADAGTPPSDDAGSEGADAGPLDPIADIGQPELTRRVDFLAADERGGRDEGSPGGIAAREFLIAELEGCGVAPAVDGG